ncbi:MAG: RNA polymerase sigma factor [Deltaproteobacteria bacterium]|nr:RNA polymerase sigma factor [Deltaproteobacteria bacterium]
MTEARPEGVARSGAGGGGPDLVVVAEAPADPGAGLIARHRAGERGAFEALVGHYRGSIYGFYRRNGLAPEVADDLFQDTFLRVHQHAASYAPERPFRVWLFTIAHNLLRSHWRKRAVRRILVDWWAGSPDDGRPLDPPDGGPSPADAAETGETLAWLEGALGALAEGPRQALLLTQVEGLKLTEAADVLGVPVATVKTWVHRGRRDLALARRARSGGSEA